MSTPRRPRMPIPAELNTPPVSQVAPPVQTLRDTIPYEQLHWPDFERLCLRLAREEAEVEDCRRYGTQGDEQYGIDLYGRRKFSDKYVVYQCKNVKHFGPSKIQAAVSEFLAGEWPGRTEKFVLCMREGVTTKDREEAIRAQAEVLRGKGIEFEPWDRDALDDRLRQHPRIVHDFFGQAWVECFNGRAALGDLGTRLDAGEVRRLRVRLSALYLRIFNQLDPGLPHPDPSVLDRLSLEERFILPDVYERKTETGRAWPKDVRTPAATKPDTLPSAPGTPDSTKEGLGDHRRPTPLPPDRIPIEGYLSSASRAVVLGGPGAGKSSLLRYLALDVLREVPHMANLARGWGSFLPIWVPFAMWTRLVAQSEGPPAALSDLIRRWLHSYEEDELWLLVEKALGDERLLLLVDGLDEWATESAARVARDLLDNFVLRHGTAAVVTSRPHGFERLGPGTAGWRTAELAGFSQAQQRQYATRWIRHWQGTSKQVDGAAAELARDDQVVGAFLSELAESPDLPQLAEVPLLLGLLLHQHARGRSAPRSRFHAYRYLIDELIDGHPTGRRRAALETAPLARLRPDDLRQLFAALAYHAQASHESGAVTQENAHRTVRHHLQDPDGEFGYPPAEARELALECLAVAEDSVGLLVRTSPETVGFFHPALREYLVAEHLSKWPSREQELELGRRCTDPRWREVILGLIQLTRSPECAGRMLDVIRAAPTDRVGRHLVESIVEEATFGDFGLPARRAKELAQETFERIELPGWAPRREQALRFALQGLRSPSAGPLVRQRVRAWFPRYRSHNPAILEAVGGWPRTEDTVQFLYRALGDEGPGNQRASAQALARLAGGDSLWWDRILELARTPGEHLTIAAAHDALFRGWPDHPNAEAVVAAAWQSTAPEVRLLAAVEMKRRGRVDSEVRDQLLRLGAADSGVASVYHNEVVRGLIAGWPAPDKETIKSACLSAAANRGYSRKAGLGREVALLVLLRGFSGDEEVAHFLVEEIRTPPHPFIPLYAGVNSPFNPWRLLAASFRGHPALAAAIDDWVVKQTNGPDLIGAALQGRTPTAKARLLALLDHEWPFWAASALLEGWGMADPEVEARLRRLATGNPAQSSSIGSLLPRILADPAGCRKRLMELLRRPDCHRPDFLVRGLADLSDARHDPEVPTLVLDLAARRQDADVTGATGVLIEGWAWDPRVREFALRQLREGGEMPWVAARAFGQDPEVRAAVMRLCFALPPHLRGVLVDRLFNERGAFAREVLAEYGRETDSQVRCLASADYHTLLETAKQDTTAEVVRLREALAPGGLQDEAQFQAAFCGLAALGQFDVVMEAWATAEAKRPALASAWLNMNETFLRCVLENWGALKDAFGKDFFKFFSLYEGEIRHTLGMLCTRADKFPQASCDILAIVEEEAGEVFGPDVLDFIGRIRPKSPLLAQLALRLLSDGGTAAGSPWRLAAAGLLGEHFAGDDGVLERLLGLGRFPLEDPVVAIAVATGWPGCAVLDRLWAAYLEHGWPWGVVSFGHLASLKADCDRMLRFLLRVVNCSLPAHENPMPHFTRPVVCRLRRDPGLAETLLRHLRSQPTASEKTSFARLLASAGVLAVELRDWCLKEIERQYDKSGVPEFGMDPPTAELRPVAHVLLGLLTDLDR